MSASENRFRPDAELTRAGLAYANAAMMQLIDGAAKPALLAPIWPFRERFAPENCPIANWTKAGSLIAAEIDRLLLSRPAK